MNCLKLIAAAMCLVSSIAVCRANLGETEAQCIARYGEEFDVQANMGFDVVGDKAASFNVKAAGGPLVMHVIFLNGVAAMEKITNGDSSHDMSEEQKQSVFHAESAGFEWSKKSTHYRTDGGSDYTSGSEEWRRSDGAHASCWMAGKLTFQHGWGEIDLSTEQYAAAQRALDRQD